MRVPGSRAQGWGSLWSESESPTHPPGPALTIHAGEGQRLRPELLLHGDLQVELDVIHACDDFLHGGGGGLGPSSPLRSLRRSSHFTLLLPVPFSIAAAAAAAAPRGMPGVPEPAPAFFFSPIQTQPMELRVLPLLQAWLAADRSPVSFRFVSYRTCGGDASAPARDLRRVC